jgi:predicted TIM-barrel fold metal-dependent hydrolase
MTVRPAPQQTTGRATLTHARRTTAVLCLQLALWLAACPAALTQEPAEVGPEDVPADNRFDPGRMISSLVVAHTELTRFRYPVTDAHSHDSYAQTPEEVAAWVQLQKKVNVARCFIFTGKSGEEFRAAAARYAGPYPGRFVMFAGISAAGIGTPAYAELLRERLRADVQAGALGLGELTDKGMGLVHVGDQSYYIDDPVFDPLWDEAGKLRVPVFVHIAEPAVFYQPPDERNDLRRSLNWSLYNKGTPGFEDMEARFYKVIARHPHTRFVAVHAFNLSNDLARVGALLDKYPNVQVDFAARMWELARQPFSARRFFIKYSRRILFGTDNDPTPAMYLAHVRQLETEDEWFWPADAEWWRGYGMHLPDSVLHRIYHDNALALLGQRLDKQ